MADDLCDRVFMIFRGRKMLDGSPERIRMEHGAEVTRVRFEESHAPVLGEIRGVESVRDTGQDKIIRFSGDPQDILRDHPQRKSGELRSEPSNLAWDLCRHSRRRKRMNRTLSIALNDYRQTVLTKTFLISILLMPLVFLGILVVQVLAVDIEDTKVRRVAIVDCSGILFEELQSKARRRNQRQIFRGEGEAKKRIKPRFLIEPCSGATASFSIIRIFPHPYSWPTGWKILV